MSWLCSFSLQKALLTVLLTFATTPVLAAADVCEDMASFSCELGRYDDGTGSVEFSDDGSEMKKDFELDGHLQNELESRLKKTVEFYIYTEPDLILDGLGIRNHYQCKSWGSESCLNFAAEQLSRFVANKMKLSSVRAFGDPDLRYQKKLVDESWYSSTTKWLEGELRKKNPTLPETEKKIKAMFPQIKEIMIKKIQSLPMDEKQKAIMVNRVKQIKFGGTRCDSDEEINQLYVSNASYLPYKHEVQFCKGLLGKDFSEFTAAQVLGHEIAHSIDPCSMGMTNELVGELGPPVSYTSSSNRKNPDSAYPVPGLLACLRSSKSIGASDLVDATKGSGFNPYCDNYKATDQTGESVADWFGIEVMTEYIIKSHSNLTAQQWQYGTSNIYRKVCTEQDGKKLAVHPQTKDRINRILIQNSVLRKKMGCTQPSKNYIYCDASNPDAIHNLISTPESKRIEKFKSIRGVN